MNPYITFRDKDNEDNLSYFILSRKWPYYIGKITDQIPQHSLIYVAIPAHRLFITYYGVLEGPYIPAQKNILEEIQTAFTDMADWYYANRILPEAKKYKKFAL